MSDSRDAITAWSIRSVGCPIIRNPQAEALELDQRNYDAKTWWRARFQLNQSDPMLYVRANPTQAWWPQHKQSYLDWFIDRARRGARGWLIAQKLIPPPAADTRFTRLHRRKPDVR